MPVLESLLRPDTLYLWNNEFDHLDNLTFVPAASYAPYVKTLDFSNNKIEYIRPGAFATLKNLNNLYLHNNLFTEIEDYTFYGSGLGRLSLSYNRIQNISTEAFAGLSGLNYLYLSKNTGNLNLYRGVFKDLTRLNRLELDSNSIEKIPPGMFESLENLSYLILSDNLLTEIEDFTFSGLENLGGQIKLDKNRIRHISMHAFAGLSRLSELILSDNFGLNLYGGVFKNLTQLKSLELASCAIEVIPPGWFEGLDNLERLYLARNLLTEMADFAFSDLENFTGRLVLSHNKIQHISSKAFVRLGSLNSLDLDNNDGITLYSGIFKDLTRLNQLVLYRCGLVTIPPGSFEGLDHLVYLDLDYNQFATLERHSFKGLTLLRTLDLYRCELVTIPPDSFEGLDHLEFLYLPDNEMLTGIGDNAFSALINLRKLFIDQNSQLSYIAALAFDGLTKMETLELHENKLDTLSAYTVSVLDDLMTNHSLTELSLHDNPWHCDCDLLPFSKLIQPAHLTEVGATIATQQEYHRGNDLYYLPLCSNLDGTPVPELYYNSSLRVSCEAMMDKVSSEAMIGAMIDEATCLLPCTDSRYILVVFTALFRFFLYK